MTQRITKYPVLINRILQHSHGEDERGRQGLPGDIQGKQRWGWVGGSEQSQVELGWGGTSYTFSPAGPPVAPGIEEEHQDLTAALGLVKELLSNVDQDVHELEKGARLQEIYNRMDPRAQTPVPGKGPFGREELLRRKLIHDGCLLWKTATGRFKGQWPCRQT